jgi:hypothetical protein
MQNNDDCTVMAPQIWLKGRSLARFDDGTGGGRLGRARAGRRGGAAARGAAGPKVLYGPLLLYGLSFLS